MQVAAWASLLPPHATCCTVPATAITPLACQGHGAWGEPLWPPGLVGSVTHAGGYRTVATAPRAQVGALGIDMEPLAPLPPAMWPRLFDPAELGELLALPAPQRGVAALARWCLKEALFKALLGRLPLDQLPLCREGAAWRLAPALSVNLCRLGFQAHGFTLRAAAACGWQRAAVFYFLQPQA